MTLQGMVGRHALLCIVFALVASACTTASSIPTATLQPTDVPFPTITPGSRITGFLPTPPPAYADLLANPATAVAAASLPTPTPDYATCPPTDPDASLPGILASGTTVNGSIVTYLNNGGIPARIEQALTDAEIVTSVGTVWDVGTLEKRPVTIDDEGRLFAPGAVDMKGGLAVAISAVKGLLELNEMPTSHPVWLMFTSDEEVGSNASMPHIEAMAKEAGLILVMEPPAPGGALKTGRKGVATYDIEVIGRASHAGNHPEEGVNAVLELAQQTVAISKLQDLRNGISVAVNTVKGGTATNVIPASAQATVDVRTFKQYDMDYIHEELMGLLPKIPGSQVNVTLHHMRGPMERNDQMIATFEQARAIGKAIDLTITEDTVGGGSDANITASMGVPTLDGLGARGEGLHAEHEHVIIRSLPERAAHLAAILRDWQFGA
ncbi:MAG: M20/M25/M40 family metallo-hydrolase [Chloroflexota bacterium]